MGINTPSPRRIASSCQTGASCLGSLLSMGFTRAAPYLLGLAPPVSGIYQEGGGGLYSLRGHHRSHLQAV